MYHFGSKIVDTLEFNWNDFYEIKIIPIGTFGQRAVFFLQKKSKKHLSLSEEPLEEEKFIFPLQEKCKLHYDTSLNLQESIFIWKIWSESFGLVKGFTKKVEILARNYEIYTFH
ncbi:MAG: hypothetical protein AAF806_08920 [Bacteroidota bacterium]